MEFECSSFFESHFGVKHKFEQYFRESSWLGSVITIYPLYTYLQERYLQNSKASFGDQGMGELWTSWIIKMMCQEIYIVLLSDISLCFIQKDVLELLLEKTLCQSMIY